MQKELYKYLIQFISDHKIALFDDMILNRTKHITVVLENIYHSHNASAVLRSCDCFGIQDVHIIENGNEYLPYRDVTVGSKKWLTQYKYNEKEKNTTDCLKSLKAKGYKIIATTPHEKSVMIKDLPLDDKTALVFGTEKEGISQEVIDHADGFVKIPMYGFTESYNISVATALSLYQLKQNLNNSSIDWQLNESDRLKVLNQWAVNSIKLGEQLKKEFLKNN